MEVHAVSKRNVAGGDAETFLALQHSYWPGATNVLLLFGLSHLLRFSETFGVTSWVRARDPRRRDTDSRQAGCCLGGLSTLVQSLRCWSRRVSVFYMRRNLDPQVIKFRHFIPLLKAVAQCNQLQCLRLL